MLLNSIPNWNICRLILVYFLCLLLNDQCKTTINILDDTLSLWLTINFFFKYIFSNISKHTKMYRYWYRQLMYWWVPVSVSVKNRYHYWPKIEYRCIPTYHLQYLICHVKDKYKVANFLLSVIGSIEDLFYITRTKVSFLHKSSETFLSNKSEAGHRTFTIKTCLTEVPMINARNLCHQRLFRTRHWYSGKLTHFETFSGKYSLLFLWESVNLR